MVVEECIARASAKGLGVVCAYGCAALAKNCFSESFKFYPVVAPDIGDMICGDIIREEFKGVNIDVEQLVQHALVKANDVLTKDAYLLFGPAGHAKSTLINSLQEHCGDPSPVERYAHTSSTGTGTYGVDIYERARPCAKGSRKQLFFDTVGFVPGRSSELLRMVNDKIRECGLDVEVFRSRAVCVCVVSGLSVGARLIEDAHLKQLVQWICDQLCKDKPGDETELVLQPVVTMQEETAGSQTKEFYRQEFQNAVRGGHIRLEEPIHVNSLTNHNIPELVDRLHRISDRRSERMAAVVRRLISKGLREYLISWHRKNPSFNTGHLLVRRYLRSVAHLHGVGLANFDEVYPNFDCKFHSESARWAEADRAVEQIKQFATDGTIPSSGCFPSCHWLFGVTLKGADEVRLPRPHRDDALELWRSSVAGGPPRGACKTEPETAHSAGSGTPARPAGHEGVPLLSGSSRRPAAGGCTPQLPELTLRASGGDSPAPQQLASAAPQDRLRPYPAGMGREPAASLDVAGLGLPAGPLPPSSWLAFAG